MQLSSICISNILSFPPLTKDHEPDVITFDDNRPHDINVIIGPNGSGKSNFLEIINQVFKVGLYNDFVLHRDHDSDQPIRLTQRKQHYKYLVKHFAGTHEPSYVDISLLLSERDYAMIEQVFAYQEFFVQLRAAYSDLSIEFPPLGLADHNEVSVFRSVTHLNLRVDLDIETSDLIVQTETLSELERAWLFYLQYFELFQLSLVLRNHHLCDCEDEIPIVQQLKSIAPVGFSLHGNFATLGSSREFTEGWIDTKVKGFSGLQMDDLVYSQDTKKNGLAPIGYFLSKKRLLEHHQSQSSDLTLAVLDGLTIDEQLRLAKQKADYHSNFYEMLRYYVKAYTDYDMVSFVKDEKIVLFFVDQWDNFYRINELSSGEQSFLYIIFTLFGYGLENGMMIIDEPEVHLHPQRQKMMLRMLQEIAQQYHIQILMATHSPLMITEDTISHVYRLHWRNIGTSVVNPAHHFSAYESNLIQMLKFGYIAKVFFVDKIIMVEGDTDEYFFSHYLEYLHDERDRRQINDFAIINVNGKGGYKTWKKFLAKFGIESYYIGDWDNIIDTGFQIQFGDLWKKQKDDFYARKGRHYPNGRKRHWRKSYGYLVKYLQQHEPDLYEQITTHIDGLYEDDVYLLRYGDLEWYLGLRIKGLDETVKFCHHDFDQWMVDERFDEERAELEDVFRQIFGS